MYFQHQICSERNISFSSEEPDTVADAIVPVQTENWKSVFGSTHETVTNNYKSAFGNQDDYIIGSKQEKVFYDYEIIVIGGGSGGLVINYFP